MKITLPIVSKFVRKHRSKVFESYVVLALLSFLALSVAIRLPLVLDLDTKATRFIQSRPNTILDYLMQLVSLPGRSPYMTLLVVAIAIFLLSTRLRRQAIYTLGVASFTTLLSTGLKLIISRPRPSGDLIKIFSTPSDWGFPSGHVLSYTTYFGFLLFLAYMLLPMSKLRTTFIVIFISLIALIGPSRVYLGEHWASDTLASYLLGSVILYLTIHLYIKNRPKTDTLIDPKPSA